MKDAAIHAALVLLHLQLNVSLVQPVHSGPLQAVNALVICTIMMMDPALLARVAIIVVKLVVQPVILLVLPAPKLH